MKTAAKKKKSYGKVPCAFKPSEAPHLGPQVSQCGQRAYLRPEDARALGATVCRACGLYHVQEEKAA